MIRDGWRITFALSAIVASITLPIFFLKGNGDAGLHLFIRTTARCSVILFLSAFSASALVKLYPQDWTRWLARNRRYIGVSFAFSHTLHLFGILTLIHRKPDTFTGVGGAITYIGGGLAFLLIYAMAATSFDSTAAWIGPRAWRILHKVGIYYVWAIFFQDYIGLTVDKPAIYLPFGIAVTIAPILRLVAWRKKRRQLSAQLVY